MGKVGFEGGQSPLALRLPKRGFNNKWRRDYEELSLERLAAFVRAGRLDSSRPITMRELVASRCIRNVSDGVKLLSNGAEAFDVKVELEVSRASQKAIAAVEAAGGMVTTVYYNRVALRALLKPHKFDLMPHRAYPPPRLMPYYLDFANRGEFSREMLERRGRLHLLEDGLEAAPVDEQSSQEPVASPSQ